MTASTPYLEVLDRFDRCQTLASANRVYDDEARKKLMDKIKRLANKLDIDENFAAAAQAHLKKTGQIPDDELGEAAETERTRWARQSRRPRPARLF